MILARRRRLGESFSTAWPRTIEALATPAESRAERSDSEVHLAALECTEEHWRAGYERNPPPRGPTRPLPRLRSGSAPGE